MQNQDKVSRKRFTNLLSTLTNRILEDPTNQFVIYEYLDSQNFKELFRSLQDTEKRTRITAAFFICKLLQENPRILQSLLTREGCEVPVFPSNYFIGLNEYRIPIPTLQKVLSLSTKAKYSPNSMCFYINLSTLTLNYVAKNQQAFDIDPKENIIGLSFIQQSAIQQFNQSIQIKSKAELKLSKQIQTKSNTSFKRK